MMMLLIEADLIPMPLWESDCTKRLSVIKDIPAGKCIYWFERTDMVAAFEALGDRVALRGNVSPSLLATGQAGRGRRRGQASGRQRLAQGRQADPRWRIRHPGRNPDRQRARHVRRRAQIRRLTMANVRRFDVLRQAATDGGKARRTGDGAAAGAGVRLRQRARPGPRRLRLRHRRVGRGEGRRSESEGRERIRAAPRAANRASSPPWRSAPARLGQRISSHVNALFAERRVSLALALDALGNAMVMEASRRLQDLVLAVVRKRGLTMAGELRPGDPGLALEAQPTVLKLSGAERIGVDCTPGLNLSPHKSTSVVLRRRTRSAGDQLVALRRLPLARDLPREGLSDGPTASVRRRSFIASPFSSVNREIACGEDETLIHAARRHGVRVVGACGGRGACGSCTVRLVRGQALLDGEALVGPGKKWRRACRLKPRQDCAVEIAPRSLAPVARAMVDAKDWLDDVAPAPAVRAFDVRVAEPSLADPRGDFERLVEAIPGVRAIDLAAARALPEILRANCFSARVFVRERQRRRRRAARAARPWDWRSTSARPTSSAFSSI